MTPFQFIILSLFIVTCIYVTYTSQRKQIGLLKQRDLLMAELENLINQSNYYYPEGLSPQDEHIVRAKKVLISIIRPSITEK